MVALQYTSSLSIHYYKCLHRTNMMINDYTIIIHFKCIKDEERKKKRIVYSFQFIDYYFQISVNTVFFFYCTITANSAAQVLFHLIFLFIDINKHSVIIIIIISLVFIFLRLIPCFFFQFFLYYSVYTKKTADN